MKALIFDLDQTLVDYNINRTQAVNRLLCHQVAEGYNNLEIEEFTELNAVLQRMVFWLNSSQ